MNTPDPKKVGGTDVSALVGQNPYKKPIDVYRRIVEGHEAPSTPAMRRGLRLEPVLRQEYADETGAKVLDAPSAPLFKESFLRASLDGIAERDLELRVLELKTANVRQEPGWGVGSDEVPAHYLLQCQWYMKATKLPRADLAVLLSGTDFRVYTLQADIELQDMLMDAAYRFWTDHVLTRRPPPPDSSESYGEWLKARYPRHDRPFIATTPAIDTLALALRTAEREFECVSDEIERFKNELKAAMGDAEGVSGPWGKITWKTNRDSQQTDWRALCAELRPDPELVAKHTTTRHGARVFRPTWAEVES